VSEDISASGANDAVDRGLAAAFGDPSRAPAPEAIKR
jgi:hypothetical protein